MKLNNTKYVVLGLIAIVAILLVSNYIKSENSKKSEQLTFEKKKECASYSGEINKKIPPTSLSDGEVTFEYRLDEAWYSPVLNSCLYSTKILVTPNDPSIKPFYTYTITDYFENKEIPLSFTSAEMITGDPVNDHYKRFELTKVRTKGEQI